MINSKDDFNVDNILNNVTVSKIKIEESTTFSIQLTERKERKANFSENINLFYIILSIVIVIVIAVFVFKVKYSNNEIVCSFGYSGPTCSTCK